MIPRLGFVPGDSALHRLDPVAKAVILACVTVYVVWLASTASLLVLAVAIAVLFPASGVGLGATARKLRFIATFGLLIFASHVLFVRSGEVLARAELLDWRGVELAIVVTRGGILQGLRIALRFLCIIMASMLFVATTDPSRLAYALMRSGVPYRYGFTLVIALRFVPLFDLEATAVQGAQRARGLDIDRKGVRQVWRLARYTFVPLLATALSRVDALSRSMESRGFGISRSRTYLRDEPARPLDWAVSSLALLAVLLLFAGRLGVPWLQPPLQYLVGLL